MAPTRDAEPPRGTPPASSPRAPTRLDCPPPELPRALAKLHADAAPGEHLELLLPASIPARDLERLLAGAGLPLDARRGIARARSGLCRVRVTRARTLPDWVAPRLRLLLCGLNPSIYAADTGVPFGRPGNRLWPALARSGLVSRDRDLAAALAAGIGFTDLVKRATRSAAELTREEYRSGLDRIAWLARELEPQTLCFVGLSGFRAAHDRTASAGPIPSGFAGRRAYLMPSTSGRNAHASIHDLAEHLRRAAQA